jgi:hypothetical protein
MKPQMHRICGFFFEEIWMKIYFMGLSLIFLFSVAFSKSLDYPPDIISGNYDCRGTEFDTKKPFQCKMRLIKTGMTYENDAQCDDGSVYKGTGIYNKTKQILAIIAVNPKASQETGVALVDVNKNGSLTSVWTYLNKTTLGHTDCIKNKN